ncbi:hypothetical protein BKA65DRAFT_540182 [Rhexocercosporidium sp. MPI-PUGE-AT-0058]|nr:hypothetical protein BKA65DRAFT_540182 [Rhexocercosporidium sp. MPI-PUGE-AT-0058]
MHQHYTCFLLLLSLVRCSNAQTVQCGTLGGGCSDGNAHDAGLRGAIASFQSSKVYGGGSVPIVFSSSLSGTSLVQIAYSCLDGSVPPPISGSSVQSSLQSILSCPNQCGSISVSTNCGFGVLTANDAAAASCFSKAINVLPAGRDPSETPVVGTFLSIGCWIDGVNARALTGGSSTAADMTVEKCTALAKGFKYAGVEYGVECYWGNTIASASSQALGQCDMLCGGSSTSICGGGNRISLYQDYTYAPPPSTAVVPAPTTAPTVVPSSGSFKSKGCYVDSGNARVLVVDSVNDYSTTGMTVQKCVQLAQRRGLSECYVGNTIHNPATTGQADCSVPCSGDPTQICGNGNRLQVYEDTTWSNPVVSEVIAALQAYTDKLAEVVEAISLYKTCLLALQSVQGQKVRKRQSIKRESIELQNLRRSQAKVGTALGDLGSCENDVRSASTRASNLDIVSETNPLLNPEQRLSLESGMDTSNTLSRPVQAAIADDQVSMANSETPLLNYQRDLAVVDASVAIGIPAWVGPAGVVASGVFLIFAAVISALGPKPGQDAPITTAPTITTTSTTTTSSTTSSATATGTPYFIVAKIGTNQAEFENLVSSLPKSSDDVHISYPLVGVFAHVATINETVLQSIQKNPILETVILSRQSLGSPSKAKRSILQNSASHNDARSKFQKRATRKYPEWVFEPTNVVPQPNSPDQLRMLSQKNWFTDDSPNYDGKEYLTERPSGQGTRIYIIDTGVEPHQEFVGLTGSAQYVAKGASPTTTFYHGNCVASQAVGATLGVAKDAFMYSVKIAFTEHSIFDGFVHSVNDVIQLGLQGKAVINMSFGGAALPASETDWYEAYIQWAINNGIVVVAAAGNDGDNDGIPTDPSHVIDSVRPSRYGQTIPGFLAVGSVDLDGFRSDITPKCTITDAGSDCLQAYALGKNVLCATLGNAYEHKTGTSFAAPQVAGLAAYLIAHPNPEVQLLVQKGGYQSVAKNVEQLIADMSYRRYEGEVTDGESPNTPDIIFNGAVINVNRIAPVPLLE